MLVSSWGEQMNSGLDACAAFGNESSSHAGRRLQAVTIEAVAILKRFGLMRRTVSRIVVVTACLSLAPVISDAFAQEETVLPGGASALQETYQDWLVACVQDGGRRCALSQRTQQNGQQLLAIELTANADGETATGTLVLPFGLALDAGVTLQVDDNPVGAPLPFNTCYAGGCAVSLSFDAETLAALRAGGVLKAMAKAANSDRDIPMAISLKGFGAAFDRVSALTR